MRTTTVDCKTEDGEQGWICHVKPDKGLERWDHLIIVNAPTDAECKQRADIITEALNKGETK